MAIEFDLRRHDRRSIRMKGYDYAQPGTYFVSIVTKGRHCLFGDIVDNQMRLSHSGDIVQATWQDLPNHYPHIRLDEFIIMPNHVHGIIVLMEIGDGRNGLVGAGLETRPYQQQPARHGLPEIVRAFKSFSARCINQNLNSEGSPVWQRNYYERIIRDKTEWERIRLYIQNNPKQWFNDRNNPKHR